MTAEVTTSRGRATGRTLLIVCALGAAGFAGWSLAQLQLATDQTFLGEAWHAFGLIVFAGLFALVAWRPRAYPGLMELTIVHSIGMFMLALTNQDADGATATMILHGLLALALLVAYVVLGCVKAWGHQPDAPAGSPASVSRSKTKRGAGAAKESPATGQQGSRPAADQAPRGLDASAERTSKQPRTGQSTQSGTQPETQPGAQPTRPMPEELPEDRLRG